jgi:rhamnose utilization protein RhaD (predicted bifunctional aldolase and dehydrogenase)/NAD(P)-dependent dehydrogenase (short-subunit alcohol dehydrogenase family)
MRSLWNKTEAENTGGNLLKLRVYSSQLLGQDEDLVLHGGGNTSVKTIEKNIFGEEEDLIHIKGSGWDLATIEEAGFSPVKLKNLLRMAELDHLTDIEMVKYQRMAMTDPAAPNPSVEAILHAIIPYTFVDHTHADAVVTVSNTANGKERIQEIFGNNILIVPYVMPGFLLAKEIYRLTKGMDWGNIEGMILLNHGVFTFNNDARLSYEKMIDLVTRAENYLTNQAPVKFEASGKREVLPIKIAQLRKNVSKIWGKPILAQFDDSEISAAFSNMPELQGIADRGPLTPDHIIRTKRTPVILSGNHEEDISNYTKEYQKYFNESSNGDLISLDLAPRWAVWPGFGTFSFGTNEKNKKIVHDISRHTMKAIFLAEQLGGWQTLSKSDLFAMEYWVLEQEKLKKDSVAKPMQGKIALVTGSASGIGKACVERLVHEGAVVAALDINPSIKSCFNCDEILGLECDVTDTEQLERSIKKTISHFGGLDMLVSNAGIFPKSFSIGEMDDEIWGKSMDINVTSHQRLLKICLPYLDLGIDPAIVIIGSKNVPAPGPGASAYSVAKAGLTQLGRIAALEFGEKGIRVNILHPNAVFDTAIWTDEILKTRAGHYGLTVEEYKTKNILKVEVTSGDVAGMAVKMLGPDFSKITGAQISIDGGNERTI